MTIPQLHQLFLASNGVCTDTRKIKQNSIFFALKGDNFNGNIYAKKALELGVTFAIIDEIEYNISQKCILVDDVLKTLQDLASYHREYLDIPVIALTGSNGKTTTKELINAVLSSQFKTTATLGNLNNHIGVPLTLLSMTKDTEIGIVEMGANHIGEIRFLSTIAKPDYGYITNIGKAHLEGFGSIEGVLKGKTELYDYLKKQNKLVFLNIDDHKLLDASQGVNTYTFSKSDNSDAIIKVIDVNPNVIVSYQDTTIKTNLIGEYNFTNIAAAITIGSFFNITADQIKVAIESYIPNNNRSQIIKKQKHTIILDAYNANPTSMTAAISNFVQLKYKSKIMFLGDMFELGKESSLEHQKIVDEISKTKVSEIYLIGNIFFETKCNDPRVQRFRTFEELETNWNIKNNEDAILIKGSRGMKLERILDLL
ncbi:UDP-N-acetylmuramoyl-tripeptide--D-alanyl-D-alanine ligase [Aquimarina muelleri]|uniref:UDP-N-acetylmuramoyl-tripeptide--D-alanyl-D-alanine ligase n=1 Tax=Aquimarina muelleri TaxID=279356 RepID=A0A918N338_9FLAO|nr:UDP-N-acetylmuramoyl-tripeptide--D-alanyl-D-alanine ligase [Aquimarina muelleri]MCX2762213.1 UDP-N-acetylmuramoyl-tripeptide--D-alanyl-D-alanine ligase [Aquimarina muelleri]GGX16575.1 UDP-N-acetylmuramoyl-tripeptide--D-alanyl-D-alanine ligase [Aquimarina muelleri]